MFTIKTRAYCQAFWTSTTAWQGSIFLKFKDVDVELDDNVVRFGICSEFNYRQTASGEKVEFVA